MKNKFLVLIFFGIAVAFVSGCYHQGLVPPPDQDEDDQDVRDRPDITTTITPARDTSGVWSTLEVAFTDRIQDCAYKGDMTLNLNQAGNNVVGGYTVTVTEAEGNNCVRIGTVFPPFGVAGTVSASAINMKIANTDDLKGSFTADTMTLRQDKCEECGAGPAIVFAGPIILRRQ